jgi:hypothetical protein
MDAAQSRRNALGRLVAHENNASDLLAFLFEMDPKPMVGLLSLEDSHHTCRREAQAQGAKKGRLDLVVRRQADGKAVAVLEMKGASDLHGDQLDRYNSWAKRINPALKQFYCTLDGDGAAPPASWQPLSLVQLFGAWRTSNDAHAACLAGEIADVLRTTAAKHAPPAPRAGTRCSWRGAGTRTARTKPGSPLTYAAKAAVIHLAPGSSGHASTSPPLARLASSRLTTSQSGSNPQ